MLSIFLEQVQAVEHADHDLSVGEIFGEAFVGDVVQGFVAGLANDGEIFGLKCGDGAGLECGVIGDAVDREAAGNGLRQLLLGDLFLAHLADRRQRL